MKIMFASKKSMEDPEKVSQTSLDSARIIYPDVKVDYVTAKHIGFTCKDKRYDTKRSVIYYGERKFEDSWNCDCQWFSLKAKYCKHILAVFQRILKDSLFLKKFEKEAVDL